MSDYFQKQYKSMNLQFLMSDLDTLYLCKKQKMLNNSQKKDKLLISASWGFFFSRDFPSFCLYFFLSRSQLYYARAVGLLFIGWRVFLHILHYPRSSFFHQKWINNLPMVVAAAAAAVVCVCVQFHLPFLLSCISFSYFYSLRASC